jgi:hypothetical protein
MLTLVVGNSEPTLTEDLCTEYLKLMPSDLVKFFRNWYTDHENQVIRTYTDTLINYVGQLIEDGELKPEQVKVITEFGIHRFDASGVLDSSWPYGIFSWDN